MWKPEAWYHGPSLATMFRQAAIMAVQDSQGHQSVSHTRREPTRFELVVNATTTKYLQLMIPREALLRADDVID